MGLEPYVPSWAFAVVVEVEAGQYMHCSRSTTTSYLGDGIHHAVVSACCSGGRYAQGCGVRVCGRDPKLHHRTRREACRIFTQRATHASGGICGEKRS